MYIEIDNIYYFNMATILLDMLMEALLPGTFGKDYDVETFIGRANRYFNASEIRKTMRSVGDRSDLQRPQRQIQSDRKIQQKLSLGIHQEADVGTGDGRRIQLSKTERRC